jgi:hypothetical protein
MTARSTSRVIGVLRVGQLALFLVPFVMLLPLGRDFLTSAETPA